MVIKDKENNKLEIKTNNKLLTYNHTPIAG